MELIVFGILLLLGISNAQIVQDGQCDESIQLADKFIIKDVNISFYNIEYFILNISYLNEYYLIQITNILNNNFKKWL